MASRSRSSSPSQAGLPATAVDNASAPSALAADASPSPEAKDKDVILQNIAARQDAHEFPSVLPSEVDVALASQATDALMWVLKDDHVRLQSFIDAKYSAFRQSLPSTDLRAESVIHAEWARDCYYFHVRSWLAQNNCVGTDEFIPLVLPQLLPCTEQQDAEHLLLQLRPEHRPAFEQKVKCALASFLQTLPWKW